MHIQEVEVNQTLHSLGADLFIVTGPAGVGKSSFIKSVTGEDVYIGSTLESGMYHYCLKLLSRP